jgi:hypothetical protein
MTEDDRDETTRREAEPEEKEPATKPERKEPPETARNPAPGIEHDPEPSSRNLIPTKDRPGTL